RQVEPTEANKANIAAQFEQTVADVLCEKVRRAMQQTEYPSLVVAGGVAANQTLRTRLCALADSEQFEIYFPPLKYCTDNGAMIAYAGAMRLLRGEKSDFSIQVRARWPLTELKPP